MIYLMHHGIKGQKWGVKHGPPYPLVKRPENNALATGKETVFRVLKSFGNLKTTGIPFKKLLANETVNEAIINTNVNPKDPRYNGNCVKCGLAAFLRMCGYDVHAGKSPGNALLNQNAVVEECFKTPKTIEGKALKFAKSPSDAAELIKRHFGNNAEGLVGVQMGSDRTGHTFSWIVKDGKVSFFDANKQFDDNMITTNYWKQIYPDGFLHLAKLDKDKIKWHEIFKYLE